jgi:hypothetical protein
MAEFKGAKIGSGSTFLLRDNIARTEIEKLKNEKMDLFSATEPLNLNTETKTLSIDLSNCKNKEEADLEKQELQNNITTLSETNTESFNNIYDFLKYIFGESVYSTESGKLVIDINTLIQLENYNEVITTINNKLAELTAADENNKTEINETIQSLNEQITTNINQNKETSDEEIIKLKKRCSLLEKELFGDIALPPSEEAEEDYSSIDSRFDTLDEQLKTITDALKRVGIIKEE